jgi:hypothetical protein
MQSESAMGARGREKPSCAICSDKLFEMEWGGQKIGSCVTVTFDRSNLMLDAGQTRSRGGRAARAIPCGSRGLL